MAEGAAKPAICVETLTPAAGDLRRELAQSNIESRARGWRQQSSASFTCTKQPGSQGADKLSALKNAQKLTSTRQPKWAGSGQFQHSQRMPRDPSFWCGVLRFRFRAAYNSWRFKLGGNHGPKEVNAAVQQLTYVSDAIRHERFGSALSKHESSVHQYLPSPYDKREQLIAKAEGLQQLIELNNKSVCVEKTGSATATNDIRSSGYSGGSRVAC